ncbi:formylglycine-generating enzyme family protein [Erythrobacter litoralis]|uniref:formylglycine-generating enzyme family protein n=1 Tax=Erythrobacter litoralis TaxID=39960 RepID=UPI002435817A|nr:formylglycine-generating enzyme family protein [Erythrobacter litoralis]MDG6078047.1 formylglycine-generating enzyme family protein [Erythrobacter litoralis]
MERACITPSDTAIRIEGGTFAMGQEGVYSEEGPVRQTTVDGFWLDAHEVTNQQFGEFVEATGYVTVAERPVDTAAFGVPIDQIPPDLLKPGSAVFTPPNRPSQNYADWWEYRPGTNWKKPYGPAGQDYRSEEPVVHLAYEDMKAFASWRGGRLPTEAEWEFAAGAGEPSSTDQPEEANSWQGPFPMVNQETDGFEGISPVGCYKPNPHGLYDMIGNVWEMTSDLYRAGHNLKDRENPRGPSENAAYDPHNPGFISRVIKGGSYLCAPNYCQRYRPAARSGRDPGMGASNVGFRLAYDEKPFAR